MAVDQAAIAANEIFYRNHPEKIVNNVPQIIGDEEIALKVEWKAAYDSAKPATATAAAAAPVMTTACPYCHWIEVELIDEFNKAVTNRVVRITPPGKDPQDLTTDAKGVVRVTGIELGVCKIEFPVLDRRKWEQL